jgi:glycosyltransferase involved in cell wall biosynthesis
MEIDVVIPCYNYGRYLRNCVRSVLDQEGVSVRVLIIDDCSPDNTPEIGRELAAEDSRVEYRRHEKNLRHIATYNEGFHWARGDATLLLSADDLVTPGAFARATSVFEQHSDVALVYGKQIVFDEVPPSAPPVSSWQCRVVPGPQFIDQMCRTASNPVATPTAIVRTNVLQAIGGYDPSLPHTADMHYWLRCAALGSVAIIDADQAYKRMHGANMQVDFVNRVLPDLEQRLAAVQAFVHADGHLLTDAPQLVNAARKAIGESAFWDASRAFDRGDLQQCQALLAAARRWSPELAQSRAWSRLAWKRRLVGRLWGAFRPVVDRFRRQPAIAK